MSPAVARSPRRIGRLGEWGLLARLLPVLRRNVSRRVLVGPGDDCAVVRSVRGGSLLAVTTDMLVENVHFRLAWTPGEDLGHKALGVSLSDLAAMGAVTPLFGVVSLGITPKTPVDYVDRFYRGMRNLARRHGFDIVGGDTVRSERLVVSVTAVGSLHKGATPLRRNGARPGDVLLVTGTLGDAAAGLAVLEGRGRRTPAWARRRLVERFRRPEPRLALARRLASAGGVTALMDDSDGLWRSVRLMADASGVGVRVSADRLPVSAATRAWAAAAKADPLAAALTGGEDYGLLLTAGPAAARRLTAARLARAVGEILPRARGISAVRNGRPWRVPLGFEHFD